MEIRILTGNISHKFLAYRLIERYRLQNVVLKISNNLYVHQVSSNSSGVASAVRSTDVRGPSQKDGGVGRLVIVVGATPEAA